jgi:hypothetical protein
MLNVEWLRYAITLITGIPAKAQRELIDISLLRSSDILSPVTRHLSPEKSHLSRVTRHPKSHLSRVTRHPKSHPKSHLSRVTRHQKKSPVTRHLSPKKSPKKSPVTRHLSPKKSPCTCHPSPTASPPYVYTIDFL